ncbi:MAG: ACP S-malonyltransferase [Nostocoides sp.]
MIVIVCPGQGSQTPGFLSPWAELPDVATALGELGQAAGLDLLAHGTTSDTETIKDTAVAQPLIVAAGLATAIPLLATPYAVSGRLVSGHSVGEITAAALAGVITPTDAMRFVAVRGRGMAAASAMAPTGMSAVLGGEKEEVLARLGDLGLTPANMNGAGQIVAAGTMEQLGALAADPPTKTRVIPLKVAGAFHTEHMAPALAELSAIEQRVSATDTTAAGTVVVSNADGALLTDGAQIVSRLVTQVSNPVRWDLCMQSFADHNVTTLIELAPAGTLVGLAKRALPGVTTMAVKSPDDLDRARELIAADATTGA